MLISKTCQYAIRALIYINRKSQNNEGTTGIKEVAKGINSPEHFTAKILQSLAKHKLVSSIKGPGGGFFASEDTHSTTVHKIIEAIEGPHVCEQCLLGLPNCSDDKPCPAHFQYKTVRVELKQLFEKLTIGELSTKLDSNEDLFRIAG